MTQRTPELEAFWTMCADRMVRRAKMTLAETRESFDNEMGAVPLAPDCTVENFDLDGLPVEKITPKGAPADKVLLYLHGGGHIFGSIWSHRHYVSRLAAAADVTAFHIDYRLAPEHPYPAAIEDALNAYQHLLKQGIKPENLIVGGESAGGNLAAALLLTLKDKGLPQPAGVYLLSPWLDMTTTADSYTRVGTRDPMITRAGIDGVAAAYLGGQPDNPITSPVRADPSGLPPMLIHVGSEEVLLSDSTTFATNAAMTGIDVTLHVAAGMPHAWPLFHFYLPAGLDAIGEAAEWMKHRLANERAAAAA